MSDTTMVLVRPERIRLGLSDAAEGAIRLQLPSRRLWPAGLIVGGMFAIFAGVEWTTIASLSRHSVRDVFDLMFFLFQAFWVLGWSVGVAILGILTILLLFYGESGRIANGRLTYVPRLGPLRISLDYNLALVRNVRLEAAGGDDKFRVRFDYAEGTVRLGDAMSRVDAERLVRTIQDAAFRSPPVERMSTPANDVAATEPVAVEPSTDATEAPSLASWSAVALVAANMLPLAGVLFFNWDLASVMVLFWAESGVIGFYSALKMAVAGRFGALFAVPFFVGHFGGFMAGHFLFIYMFFVRGVTASGPAPGAWAALQQIFLPLWPALTTLFVSHGVSFVTNFIGRREYIGSDMTGLMKAAYNRIIVMHLTVIFGGWIILLLKSAAPALGVLVLVKTALDFTAHRKEHKRARPSAGNGPRQHQSRIRSSTNIPGGFVPWQP